jgi:riboflavin synthase
MFTGIVEATGEIVKTERTPDGIRLWIRSPALADASVGASVAVGGVCITVTGRSGDTCTFDVAPETLDRTTMGTKSPGDRVNLERPLRVGDELGGHIVQGHVDGRAIVVGVTSDDTGMRVRARTDDSLSRYIVEKGSVALDGVSLTVAAATGDEFEVMLIPQTLAVTTLGQLSAGDELNVEVDILAKHVERLLTRTGPDRHEDDGYL